MTLSLSEVTAYLSTHNIGNRCASIEIDQPWTPVSRVIVKVDENTSYSAGNTTGRTMEISCPIGTQTMANNLLTVFSGFVYKGYKATDALIKPSMELGDSVSIGGVYSIVGGMFIKGDMILAANLTAPSSGDIDHEYPYDQWKRVFVDAKNIRHGGSSGTLPGAAITPATVSSTQIGAAAITATKLAVNAVTETVIAAAAVTPDKIASAAITATKLAVNAVTETVIAAAAVTNPKIAGGAVSNAKCNSVVNQSLADADYSADVFNGVVTADYGKFSFGTVGNLSCTTMNYKGHAAQWRKASECVDNDRYVMCYI